MLPMLQQRPGVAAVDIAAGVAADAGTVAVVVAAAAAGPAPVPGFADIVAAAVERPSVALAAVDIAAAVADIVANRLDAAVPVAVGRG